MNHSVEKLQAELIATASLSNNDALGLRGEFYTSPSYFDLELSTVLRTGWHCLGRADELSKPGDFFTAQLLNEPLLVIRGNDDQIRVLSNVCRHRGMPVAEGQGNKKLFVCSYHAWSYGRDGKLLRAANMHNANFNQEKCGLPEFKSEIWQGFVYLNFDDNAPSIGHLLGDLGDLIDVYEPHKYRVVHTAHEEWACNWKCLVENFMEGYHLSVVHPETLRGYTPTELCTKAASGDTFTSYHANYPDHVPSRGNGAPGLDSKQKHRSTLFNVFPAQVASQSASMLVSLSLQPTRVDHVHVRWTMSVYDNDLTQETIDERIALWIEVNREDRVKLEKLQLALSSTQAAAGPLASDDFEGTVHDFHKYLAREGNITPTSQY